MSEKINLRMAKPNAGDMQMAKDLTQAFNDISYGFMPIVGEDESDPEMIATDYDKNAIKAFERLCEITQRGSLDRVAWTLDMLLDPENGVIDPDADHVALHPRFQLMLDALLATRDKLNAEFGSRVAEVNFPELIVAIEVAKGAPNDQQD